MVDFFTLTFSAIAVVYIFNFTTIGDLLKVPLEKLTIILKVKKWGKNLSEKLEYFLSCFFCQSFWFSLVLIGLNALFPIEFILKALAVAGVALLFNRVVNLNESEDIYGY